MGGGKKPEGKGQFGEIPVQSTGTSVGKKSVENKDVNKIKENNVNSFKNGGKVFNGVDVQKFAVLPKLDCFYTNADQLINKLNELEIRTRDTTPNIIGVTEVKPKHNRYKPVPAEYSINNYKMYSKNLETDEGRGLILYIDQRLESSELKMNITFCENLFIKIKLNNNDKLLLGLIYRSPSNNSMEYIDSLCNLLNEAASKGFSHLLLMGDFNLPNINWTTESCSGNENNIDHKFLETVKDNFLFQHIDKPTRWRGTDTPHILDLIMTNEENMISDLEYQSPIGKSDHCLLKFTYNCYTLLKKNRKATKLYSKANFSNFKEELNRIDWEEKLSNEDINANWDYFLSKMNELEEKYIPTKIFDNNKKHRFPINEKTRDLIKKKNALSKKVVTSKDPEVRKQYNRTRNKVKKEVDKIRRNFEKGLSEKAKTNPKAIWSYIKSKSKTREEIGELHLDTENLKSPKTEDDYTKANILSDYFASVFTKEKDGDIPEPITVNIQEEISELSINRELIIKYLDTIKIDKSPGLDRLHPRLLVELKREIAHPLLLIFKQSINTSKLPEDWKKAQISAIFKKGNKSQAKNYRPVSLTSIVCKTLEKIIRDHIVNHMNKNKLFSDKQYGFIKGRSTTLQLLEVLEKWTKALDEGFEVDCIYTDFMKAFDKVPHQRLMKKIENYGIKDPVLGWIRDFLSDRYQSVAINNIYSDWKEVISGIPQGSVLGPILFVLYINDLPNMVESEAYLFADDTKVFKIIERDNDSEILQQDLERMEKWSEDWLLKFHPEKCKYINVRKRKEASNRKYRLLGHEIGRIEHEKDIGVIVDEELSFERHAHEKINKATSIFAAIRRTFKYLKPDTFLPLYKTLVRSHLDYANSVWAPHKKSIIDKMESVQRRATKQIPALKNLSYTERLKFLKLPTLAYRRLRGDLIEAYKIIHGKYDTDACSILEPMSESGQRYSTRFNSIKIKEQRFKSNLRKHAFSVRTPKIWNKLPDNITNAPSLNAFKSRLDKLMESEEIYYNDYKAEIALLKGRSGRTAPHEVETESGEEDP